MKINIKRKKNKTFILLFSLLLSVFMPFSSLNVSAESYETSEQSKSIQISEILTAEEIIETNQIYDFSSEEERDQLLNDYNLNYYLNINSISTNRMQLFSTNVTAYGLSPALSVNHTYRFPAGYVSGFGPQNSDYTQTSYLPKAKNSGTYSPTTTLMLWCIEPVDLFNGGSNTGYRSVTQTAKMYKDASIVAYWGYESKKHSGSVNDNLKRAFMTEKYMQEIITGVRTINISGAVSQSEYNSFKGTMAEEVRKFNTLPSVRNSTTTVGNDSVTLTDSNNSINRYVVTDNTANIGVSISGNKITLTPNSNTKNGAIRLEYNVPKEFHRNPSRLTHSTNRQQELLDAGISDPHSITLNIQATGDLEITKTSSEAAVLNNSNYTLQGAEFLVTGPNSFRRTVSTNAQGKVTLSSIPSGEYTVTETKAPAGFTLNSTAQKTTIAGDTRALTFSNTPIKRSLEVVKQSSDSSVLSNSNYTLQGAQFLVTGPNNFSQTVTTNAQGKVTLSNLLLGEYSVKETKAPTGFTLNSAIQKKTLSSKNESVSLSNTPIRPVITVRHIDKDTNVVIETSKHTHYYNDDYTYSPRGNLKYQNKYRYYPLDQPKSGKVTSDITLDFYYTKPSVEIGFKKIQIKTARSNQGLPVSLTFNLTQIKSDWLNKRLNISIYDKTTSNRVVTKNVAISEIRNGLELTIPSSFLAKNNVNNYEARIESPNGNLYPNTSSQWNNRVFSGWQSYFETIPVGGTSALQVGDTITWSAYINPENQKGSIMGHFNLPDGSYIQNHSSAINGGQEGRVTGTTTIPYGVNRFTLALRHMFGNTPSQRFHYKELKLEHGSYATEYKSDPVTEILVTDNQARINTDGHTSSEITIEEIAKNGETLDYQGVIMTEREINKSMKMFYEYIELPLKELSDIKSGYGFELDQPFIYSNGLSETNITNQFEVLLDTAVVDGDMYTKSGNQSTINLNSSSSATSDVRYTTFKFPQVYVQEKTGTIVTPSQAATLSTRNGGNKVYVPIWIDDLGSYTYQFKNKEPIGVNEVNIVIQDELNVVAFMYAHMGSKTINQDEILIQPANLNDPFSNGLPEGWTTSDVEWLQAN